MGFPDAEPGRLSPVQGLFRLNKLMFTSLSVDDMLDRVVRLSQHTIPDANHVSVTLMDGERARTVVFTDSVARELDERQYEAGYGPCTDAALSGRTVPDA